MFAGVIYKITGRCGKVYIGSTCNYYQRKYRHNYKDNTNSKKLLKPLQFEKIRTDNYKLIKTMLLVEQYYIDIYKCVNIQRAYHNRFTRNKYNKNYYENNKEELIKKQKVKVNCPYCNSLTSKRNIKQHQKSKKCLKFQTSINSFN